MEPTVLSVEPRAYKLRKKPNTGERDSGAHRIPHQRLKLSSVVHIGHLVPFVPGPPPLINEGHAC